MTTDTAARKTPLTDAVGIAISDELMPLVGRVIIGNANARDVHDAAIHAINTMKQHARSLEAQLADSRVECESFKQQASKFNLDCQDAQSRAWKAEQDAAQMRAECDSWREQNEELVDRMEQWIKRAEEVEQLVKQMLAALEAVLSVADRQTVEFDLARAAIAAAIRQAARGGA